MQLKSYADMRLADPFLSPAWRHNRVVKMLGSAPPERCRRADDQWVRGYRTFLHGWRQSESQRNSLFENNPGLYFAYLLYERLSHNPDLNLLVEARLLAGQSYKEIAHMCKTIPETIEWYERLYFNVSDFLEHHDWIFRQVLLPAADRDVLQTIEVETDEPISPSTPITEAMIAKKLTPPPIAEPHFDMSLKFFSYYGGPHVCDVMISGFTRLGHVSSLEDVPDFFNKQFATQIARRSAQAVGKFQINKYNVMELFSIHGKLMEVQKANAGDTDSRHQELERHMSAALGEIVWCAGDRGRQRFDGTPLGIMDNRSTELAGDELLMASANKDFDVNAIPEVTFADRKPIIVKKVAPKEDT